MILLFVALLQVQTALTIEVLSESGPVPQAEIVVRGEIAARTNAEGVATVEIPDGETELTVQRYGFTTKVVRVAPASARITVELEAESVLNEEIIVTATRSDVRIEDEPLRVEVVDQEEIDEKAVMTPGDIAMLL